MTFLNSRGSFAKSFMILSLRFVELLLYCKLSVFSYSVLCPWLNMNLFGGVCNFLYLFTSPVSFLDGGDLLVICFSADMELLPSASSLESDFFIVANLDWPWAIPPDALLSVRLVTGGVCCWSEAACPSLFKLTCVPSLARMY